MLLAFGFAGLGIPELAIILLIVLIFFGAGKLPQVLGQMGKGVKAFKEGVKEGEDEMVVEAEKLRDTVGMDNQNVSEAEEVVQDQTT
jgi:sec-independent protein translocase protein TatA